MSPWSPEALRLLERVQAARPPALRASGRRMAAVLVPLIPPDLVVFTVRTASLPHHAGQVSFPGGQASEKDATLRDTALRETEEELGLQADAFEIVGRLHPVVTTTDFAVQPFVAYLRSSDLPALAPAAAEVDRVVLAPLALLAQPSVRSERITEAAGRTFTSPQFDLPGLEIAGTAQAPAVIWGATGRMVAELVDLIA